MNYSDIFSDATDEEIATLLLAVTVDELLEGAGDGPLAYGPDSVTIDTSKYTYVIMRFDNAEDAGVEQ